MASLYAVVLKYSVTSTKTILTRQVMTDMRLRRTWLVALLISTISDLPVSSSTTRCIHSSDRRLTAESQSCSAIAKCQALFNCAIHSPAKQLFTIVHLIIVVAIIIALGFVAVVISRLSITYLLLVKYVRALDVWVLIKQLIM